MKAYDVYLIECLVNGKMYIGQATQYLSNGLKWGTHGRWLSHLRDAKTFQNHCVYLDNAIRKHGPENFKVSTLLVANKADADYYEILFIDMYGTVGKNGYNLRTGGSKGTDSDITRQRKSLGQKKRRSEPPKPKVPKMRRGQRKKARKNSEDNILPRFIISVKVGGIHKGYRVDSFPIGKDGTKRLYAPNKSFVSVRWTLEEKLQLTIDHLEKLKVEYPPESKLRMAQSDARV
jgi:group I intron endonuclease